MRFALLLVLLVALPFGARGAPDDRLADAATAFVAALGDSARDEATWPFSSAERGDVHYAPFNLDGARHDELSDETRALGEKLLAAALSAEGHERVRAVRDLERDVLSLEGERFWGFATRWMRDPGRYFWAFFGEPGAATPWGFRLEGHHLSLNVTSVPGAPPASTPLFLGAQPRDVPPGLPSAGVAVLGEEERLARALYASLETEQRRIATLPYEDGRGHMLGQVGRLAAPATVGVARNALMPEQQALLDALVDRFAALWGPEISAARRAEIDAARDALHFAHVESEDPAHAWYTRVSGPGVLIEIDNTTDGDHVHAVWHRPGADFADDLLARHWEREHGLALSR